MANAPGIPSRAPPAAKKTLMPDDSAQQFLRDLDKKLWSAADRLRANLDAAVYKHAVLGLIFLKYVSDSFGVRQQEIENLLRKLLSGQIAVKN